MRPTRGDAEHTLAVFIDFENLALGFHGRRDRFRIERVLERLVEKGKIVVKKAYCDWSRFGQYTGELHESAIELIEIPKRHATGKNSADIRLVVDAVDLAYSKDHIDTFVIVSGDSDFSPLVSKLKELGKHVIGLGLQDATSELLRDNCDEFIYYEDLGRAPVVPIEVDQTLPETKQKMFALLVDSLLALRRENKDTIFSSMVKDTMKRKKPSFNEEYYGYRTFSELLEDAEEQGLLDLEKHKNSGTYVVVRFGSEPAGGPDLSENSDGRERNGNRRRRRRGGSGNRDRDREPAAEQPVAAAPVRPAAIAPPAVPARPAAVAPPALKPVAPPAPQPVRQAVSSPPPVRPSAPPPPPTRPAASKPPARPAGDDIPLGRALMDELDDEDEVPSYAPAKKPAPATKPVAAAPAKPAAAAPAKPAARKPAEPAAAKPVEKRAAEPAKKPPAKKPAAEPAKKDAEPAAKKPAEPARRRAEPAAKKPAPVPAEPLVKKPVPAEPADDSGFGAGLDL